MKFVNLLHRHIRLRHATCLFLFFSSHPVFAFGVLMTTPQQRIELDIQRNMPSQLLMPAMTHPDKAGEKVIKLDGLVKRPNGPNSVWVNGALKQRAAVSGVFIDANKLVNSAVFIKLTPGSSPLFIKPGQRLNVDNGVLTEKYTEKVLSNIETIDHIGGMALDQISSDVMTDIN